MGDGYWCSGKLPDVLADDARFSTFYSVSDALLVLWYASSRQQGGGRTLTGRSGGLVCVWGAEYKHGPIFFLELGDVTSLSSLQHADGEDLPSLPDVARFCQ